MRSAAAARLLALCCALALGACAGTQVIRGGGAGIGATQARAAGERLRIAVGGIIDKTDPASNQSLTEQLGRINRDRQAPEQMQPSAITSGIRDMLTTELFGSDRFTVLERDALKDALVEQEFSQSARAGDATRIPLGQLEGAQLLVVGAITAFDAGMDGGSLPIPVPLSERGDFGVLRLRASRGYVAMDLRVIDVKTGRVVSSTAVEGRNWRFGMDFTGFFEVGHSTIRLPGMLTYFSNTPVEEALQKMVTAAVARIAEQAPPPTVP